MSEPKLGFVIAGAQKSGTTTLDAIFRQHPQIQMARVKETHFFDNEEHDWNSQDYRPLDAHFSAFDGRLRGEATPITMYWKPAVRRLRAYNPNILILLILRDPVMRAFSNWRHERSHGRETLTFSEAIRGGRMRVLNEGSPEGQHRYCSYVERGEYGDQLLYLTAHFPKERIHCEIYEEFFEDRQAGLQRIAKFLSIERFPREIADLHLNGSRDSSDSEDMAYSDAALLRECFADQIRLVERFTDRAIPSWRLSALRAATAL